MWRESGEKMLDSLENTCKTLPKTEDQTFHSVDPLDL